MFSGNGAVRLVSFLQLLLVLLIPSILADQPGNTLVPPPPCFDTENPPSCTFPTNRRTLVLQDNEDEPKTSYDAQRYCWLMENSYFTPAGVDPIDLHLHMEAFSAITRDNETCTALRQVYHLCYWCSPLAGKEYVHVAPVCDLERPLEDKSVDVAAACDAIQSVVFGKGQRLTTIELIDYRRKVGHLCVDYCRNPDPSVGCFTPERPPSCNGPAADNSSNSNSNNNNNVTLAYDAQATCYSLQWWYFNPYQLDVHGSVLSLIHENSKLCRATRAFYHRCFWCATTYDAENHTMIPPPPAPDYCVLNCFDVPHDVSTDDAALMMITADDDRNATCEELSDILARGHKPCTIDLCERYRSMGHLCPQLKCGKYNYNASQGCFSAEHLPTCDEPASLTENDLNSTDDAQDTCYTLEKELFEKTDRANALSMIPMDSELCHATKQDYHLCPWCSTDATISNCSMPDCFTLEPPRVVDPAIDVTSACQELTDVLQRGEKPYTSDLCYKLEQVAHLCPAVCGNYNYQPEEGCFTTKNPPSCDAPVVDGNTSIIGLDEQEICNTLFVDYLDKNGVTFDSSAHLSILSKIPASSEFCASARSVYHRCFWCAPYASQSDCSHQPPRKPYCSAPLALLRANVLHDEICAQLEQVYVEYSNTGPMTIDLCQGLERYGHVCPNLCDYIIGWNGDGAAESASTDGRHEPCFKTPQDMPSCAGPTVHNDTDGEVVDEMEIQHMCFLLDREYWNDYDAEKHEDLLPKIRASSELCHAAEHAFHLCHWCTPTTRQCNYIRKLCSPKIIDDPEVAAQVAVVCPKLKEIRDKGEWPGSNDLCVASHKYGPYCPDYCENGVSNQGCFNYNENPPTCDAPPRNAARPPVEYDVQDTCYNLLANYLYPKDAIMDLSSHGQVLMGIHEDSALCPAARQAYHSCYWCDATLANTTEDFCSFNCSTSSEVFDETIDIGETCRELTRLRDIGEWPATTELCHRLQQVGHLCPNFCENFDPSFVMIPHPKSMVLLSRIASLLSLLGSAFILWDVLSSPKNRSTVYHQLLAAMAFFDIINAVAWVFARMPIPQEVSFYVAGSMGTKQTCKTQAFFIQLGYTSVLYNVSLSFYYVLVIVMGWRESDLRKMRRMMHGVPLVVGVGLAFAGIPFYHWYVYGCHLLPPPFGELWTVMVFSVIPLGFSVLSITVSMLIVYLTVRRNARASRKWSFGVGKNSLEAKVFWQAVLYAMSFYITWPIFFSVYIAATDYTRGYDVGKFALPAIVSFVAPLQGFTNFLVYVRPRVDRFIRSRASLFGSVFTRYLSTEHSPSQAVPSEDQGGTEQVQRLDPSAAIAARRRRPSATSLAPTPLVQDNILPVISEEYDDSDQEQALESAPSRHNHSNGEINVADSDKDEERMRSIIATNTPPPVQETIALKGHEDNVGNGLISEAAIPSRQTSTQANPEDFEKGERRRNGDNGSINAALIQSDAPDQDVTRARMLPHVQSGKRDQLLEFYFI